MTAQRLARTRERERGSVLVRVRVAFVSTDEEAKCAAVEEDMLLL